MTEVFLLYVLIISTSLGITFSPLAGTPRGWRTLIGSIAAFFSIIQWSVWFADNVFPGSFTYGGLTVVLFLFMLGDRFIMPFLGYTTRTGEKLTQN